MSANWLRNEIEAGAERVTRARCFVRKCVTEPYAWGEELEYYTLADYEDGGPVLGPFLNKYGEWETADEARRVAEIHGYRCDAEDDDV